LSHCLFDFSIFLILAIWWRLRCRSCLVFLRMVGVRR
jgi:hypothetical protein